MKILISNIQRFCAHDGPGLRTTVFLKGCNLTCPWCANPENMSGSNNFMFDKSKCIQLLGQCFLNEHCVKLNNVTDTIGVCDCDKCTTHAIHQVGRLITKDELLYEILKDKAYYEKDGGVTFSGGEPLLQTDALLPLLRDLIKENINIAIETALFISLDKLKRIIDYVDNFIIDLKILIPNLCKQYLGGDIEIYLKNIDYLFSKVNKEKIIIRMPLISNYTATNENFLLIMEFLKKYKPIKIEVFSVHNLAKSKYEKLNMPFKSFTTFSIEEIESLLDKYEFKNFNYEIITL